MANCECKRLAKGNGKERSVLPNPGEVGMKNNSFTSVIRKPHRGRAGLKRDAGTGEHLIFTNVGGSALKAAI